MSSGINAGLDCAEHLVTGPEHAVEQAEFLAEQFVDPLVGLLNLPETLSTGHPRGRVAVGNVPTDAPQLREPQLGNSPLTVPCHGSTLHYNALNQAVLVAAAATVGFRIVVQTA
jgi:hypothetical protein